jgi:hypothetical protein
LEAPVVFDVLKVGESPVGRPDCAEAPDREIPPKSGRFAIAKRLSPAPDRVAELKVGRLAIAPFCGDVRAKFGEFIPADCPERKPRSGRDAPPLGRIPPPCMPVIPPCCIDGELELKFGRPALMPPGDEGCIAPDAGLCPE